MTLRVTPLDDPAAIDAIDAILTDPWVASRLRHDSREPGYVNHPSLTYYGAYVDEALVGVFMAIRHTPEDVEVHAALLRGATRHGRALGRLFLSALWQDKALLRVTAPVLSTLPSAANYCRRLGFGVEGVKRRACRVRGELADVIYLGLLRAQ